MATNTLLTPDEITKEALRILHNKLGIIKTIKQDYAKYFNGPRAIGDTLRIRKPAQFTTRSGRTASIQNVVENFVNLTIDQQLGVDTEFFSSELALDMDDFSNRVLKPKMARLASEIERVVISDVVKGVDNLITSAGSAVAWADVNAARQRMLRFTTPVDDDLHLAMNPDDEAGVLNDTKDLFNDQRALGFQYERGHLRTVSGFDVWESNLLGTVTLPADIVCTAGAVTNGDTTITLNGVTDTQVFQAGSVFTIAGIKAVNPETKQEYSFDKQFAIVATRDGSGNVVTEYTVSGTSINVPVNPVYGPADGGNRQNVSALPTGGETVTFVGSASTSYEDNIAYHPEFATVAFVDLPMPAGVNEASKKTYDGVTLRYISDYDVSADKFICRFDVLFGMSNLREEYACRIWNA